MSEHRSHTSSSANPANKGKWRFRNLVPKGIHSRLFLLIILSMLPLLALLGLTSYQAYQERTSTALETELEVAKGVAAEFQAFLLDLNRQAMTIGDTIVALQANDQRDDVNELLVVAVERYPAVRTFSWVNPDGVIIKSSKTENIGTSVIERDFFIQTIRTKEALLSDLFERGITSDEITVILSTPIIGKNEDILGIVVASLNPMRLGEMTLVVERPAQGAYAIFDSKGVLVFRKPEVTVSWRERTSWLAGDSVLQESKNTGRSATGITRFSIVGGQQWFSARVPIEQYEWFAGAGRPVSVIMGPIYETLYRDALLVLLSLVLAISFAYLLARTISIPLLKMKSDVSQMEHGVPVTASDPMAPVEVNRVRQTVAGMATALLERARESERLLAELNATFNSIADSLVIYNLEGEVVRTNSAADRLIAGLAMEEGGTAGTGRVAEVGQAGSVEEDEVGKVPVNLDTRVWFSRRGFTLEGKLVAEEFLPAVRSIRGETVSGYVIVFRIKGGNRLICSVSSAPIRLLDGTIIGIVATYTDITRLQELQEQRELYIHTISHDLRNPLAVIMTHAARMVRLLKMDNRKPGWGEGGPDIGIKLEQSLLAIQKSSQRINTMIVDLVDAARLEGGMVLQERLSVNLARFVGTLLEHNKDVMDVERVQLLIPQNLPSVWADENKLERIFQNMISNALKYSSAGTPVLIDAVQKGDEIEVLIIDQGMGISEEDIPRLFERFYRGRRVPSVEGVGLGLYITRRLVEAHGGRIWVESRGGEGATFHITLPIAAEVV